MSLLLQMPQDFLLRSNHTILTSQRSHVFEVSRLRRPSYADILRRLTLLRLQSVTSDSIGEVLGNSGSSHRVSADHQKPNNRTLHTHCMPLQHIRAHLPLTGYSSVRFLVNQRMKGTEYKPYLHVDTVYHGTYPGMVKSAKKTKELMAMTRTSGQWRGTLVAFRTFHG